MMNNTLIRNPTLATTLLSGAALASPDQRPSTTQARRRSLLSLLTGDRWTREAILTMPSPTCTMVRRW